jgi:hypothetical protein
MTASFYVYTLTDPRDGAVFYVGKGKNDRLHHHERDALKGAQGRKCERIRDIAMEGMRVEASIVQRFADEGDAYDAEIALIASFGRDQLTNIMAGGFGGRRGQWPFRWTPDLVRQIAPSLRGAIHRMNDGDDMLREHAGVNFA